MQKGADAVPQEVCTKGNRERVMVSAVILQFY